MLSIIGLPTSIEMDLVRCVHLHTRPLTKFHDYIYGGPNVEVESDPLCQASL